MIEYRTLKLEDLQEDLLLNLHTKYPNTIDDNEILSVGEATIFQYKRSN
jgi:hypothetical protein